MTNTSRTTLCQVFFFFFFATALTYKDPMTRVLSNLLSTHFQGGRRKNGLLFFRHNGKGEDPGDEAVIPFLGGILCLKVAFYDLISVKLKAYSFFLFYRRTSTS